MEQGKRGGDRVDGVRRRRGEETRWMGQGEGEGDRVNGAREGGREKATGDPEVQIGSFLRF